MERLVFSEKNVFDRSLDELKLAFQAWFLDLINDDKGFENKKTELERRVKVRMKMATERIKVERNFTNSNPDLDDCIKNKIIKFLLATGDTVFLNLQGEIVIKVNAKTRKFNCRGGSYYKDFECQITCNGKPIDLSLICFDYL